MKNKPHFVQKYVFLFVFAGLILTSLKIDSGFLFKSINLIFHEAGHTLIPPFIFGTWLHVIAGSLAQILIPGLIVLYFWFRRDVYAASIVMLWLGQSFVDLSFYVSDALLQNLPLLGGDGAIHDWNYILNSIDALVYAHGIGQCFYVFGILCIGFGITTALQYLRDLGKRDYLIQ